MLARSWNSFIIYVLEGIIILAKETLVYSEVFVEVAETLKEKEMAGDVSNIPEVKQKNYDADEQVKIICLGDSAVGKSK